MNVCLSERSGNHLIGFLIKGSSSIFTLKESRWGLEEEPAYCSHNIDQSEESKWYQVFRTTRTTAAHHYRYSLMAEEIMQLQYYEGFIFHFVLN